MTTAMRRWPPSTVALLLVGLAAAAYAFFFSWLAIRRHDAFLTHTADLGQIDLAIWNTAHGRFLQEIKNEQISTRLTDHIEPVFWPLSLLLHAWDDVRVLLIAQAASLALAALPVWAVVAVADCPRGAKHSAYLFAGTWAAFAYLLAPQAQAATVADFHAAPLAALPLALLLYLGWRCKTWPAVIIAMLALAVKEEIALLVAATALYLAITGRWRPGWLLAGIAILWFTLATFVIIPQYAQTTYGGASSPYLARYQLPADAEAAGETGLLSYSKQLVEVLLQPERWCYILELMLAFAGMPMLAPEVTLIALPLVAANFLSNYNAMYSGEFHYSAPFMAVLACAAGVGARRLLSWTATCRPWLRRISVLPLIALPLAYQVAQGYTPLGREFWLSRPKVTDHQHLLARFASQIPPLASLSTTPPLYPHFSHRQFIYTFPAVADSEYVLLDVSGTTDMHPVDFRAAFQSLLSSGYGVKDSDDGYILLQRGASDRSLSSAFYDFAKPVGPPQNLLDISFGTSLRLVGYDWLDDPKWRLTRLRLYWQTLAPLTDNLRPYVIFADTTGAVRSDSRQSPFVEPLWYPLSLWPVGDTITTTTVASDLGDAFEAYVTVVINEDYADVAARLPAQAADSDGGAQIIKSTNMVRLPMVTRADCFFRCVLSPIHEQRLVESAISSGATFGSALTLHGFQVSSLQGEECAQPLASLAPAHPGDCLTVVTHWRRIAGTGDSLAMSLRLLDQSGGVLVQADGPFHSGLYPPQEWPLNSVVSSSLILTIPADAVSGTYTVALIVYDRETLKPLPLESGAQQLTLGSVVVN